MSELSLFPDELQPAAVKAPRQYGIPIYKVSLVREAQFRTTTRPQFMNSGAVATVLREYLEGVDREHFVVLLMDAKNKIIGIHTVSSG